MLVITLTGGIGSGKSTVAEQFARLGVPVIDADRIARQVVEPGCPALSEIRSAFGAEILDDTGHLRRARLGEIVFGDSRARRRLESILHPRIRSVMKQRLAALHAPYAILVIPLLLESGQQKLGDRILVVDIPEAQQIERAKQRDGLDDAAIKRILSAQCSRTERLTAADDVIDNRGDRAALSNQVEQLHRRYLALAESAPSESTD